MTTKDDDEAPAQPAPSITFVDNPHAPEVYAAEGFGFFAHLGNVHITFTTPRVNHATSPGPINRVVIGRLVMPAAGAHDLATGLFNFLKGQGFNPGVPADKSKMQ